MNKYIDYDIHNGLTVLKCAVMNILYSLDSREITSYIFNPYISSTFIESCMNQCEWTSLENSIWKTPLGELYYFDKSTKSIKKYES